MYNCAFIQFVLHLCTLWFMIWISSFKLLRDLNVIYRGNLQYEVTVFLFLFFISNFLKLLLSNFPIFDLCLLQIHLDHKHMGLGGDDSWSPCVHEQYLIPPVPYSFSVRLCLVTPSTSGHDIYRSQLQNS